MPLDSQIRRYQKKDVGALLCSSHVQAFALPTNKDKQRRQPTPDEYTVRHATMHGARIYTKGGRSRCRSCLLVQSCEV